MFVVYSGAISGGCEYFVLNKGTPPLPRKGKKVVDVRFEQLKLRTRDISNQLPAGLAVVPYRIGQRAIIRFTADSKLRSSYLRSPIGATYSGQLATFFRVADVLVARSDVIAKSFIGQRLELFLQPRFNDSNIPAEYTVSHAVLSEIEKLATDASGDRRPNIVGPEHEWPFRS